MLGALATLSLCAVLEFWRVNHAYDERGLEYRSPWSRHRSVAWIQIKDVKWRPVAKWLDMVPGDGGALFHFSPMLAGMEGLAAIALREIPESALARDPEALAALQLMASGNARALISDARKPRAIAAALLGDMASDPES